MKLILGTAEFGPHPYGTNELVPLAEIDGILTMAEKAGITILEGAESYNCDSVLTNKKFDVIYKVTHPYSLNKVLTSLQRSAILGLMYHHTLTTQAQMPLSDGRVTYRGASVYTHSQLLGSEDIVEVPLNIENKTFEKLTAPVKLVRSVFGRGELLKKYSVKDCLDYVKSANNVHGVIVGVHSKRELEEVLKGWTA